MLYRIGSFNLCKMKDHEKDEKKDIKAIARIISDRNDGFDIVALQEVFDKSSVDRIVKELGNGWESVHAIPFSRSSQAAEGYAFIWNNKKFRLATSLAENEQNPQKKASLYKYQPRIYNEYEKDNLVQYTPPGEASTIDRGLVRAPLYGRFESIGGWFEIRLINTHIMFSEHSDDSEGIIHESDAKKRKAEFEKLLQIYYKVANRCYKNNRPAYTFLLGDYNLNLKRPKNTHSPYVNEVVIVNDGKIVNAFEIYDDDAEEEMQGGKQHIKTIQDELTTLKSRSKAEPDKPAEGFANNYDHFSYDTVRFDGVGVKAQRINTVDRLFNGQLKYESHRKTVSDHIPIAMSLDLLNDSELL